MRRILPIATPLAETILSPLPPPVRQAARVAATWGREGAEWTRRLAGSVEALGLDLFDGHRRASAWLSGSAQHSGLPPTAAGGGAFGLLLQMLGHSHGWPFPRGGMQAFPDALAHRARRDGATIRCNATVSAVLTRRGRVTGVRLQDGEELAADAVVSTLSAGALVRLLPDGALPSRLQRRLRIWRYGTAPFMIHYALSAPVPWEAEEPRKAAVVHVAGELEELSAAAQAGQRGEMPERPALVVGQHTLHDPTRAPDGQHTLYVYGHVPSRYDLEDEAVADRIHAQIERFAPGFGDVVRARYTRSPAQTERDNPSLLGGDLAGGSMEIDQQLVFRPAPRMCRYRTPLRGLYIAGASVHPGPAVHGVTGRGAADALLRDRRLRPWRNS
jgi:phytoene dehydrogenase-like protein